MSVSKYIIMCGGQYDKWETPRQLIKIKGETIVERTIRLLKEQGIEDIYISTNNKAFEGIAPILAHKNDYEAIEYNRCYGTWCNGFYPTEDEACYIFGDVVFSPKAIETIVKTETKDIEFFASAPPFAKEYLKEWAEPFALKVANQRHLRQAISLVKLYEQQSLFARKPIMWELWQVIKHTPLNHIDYTNYTAINDYTCDIDNKEDIDKLLKKLDLEFIK